eukprot:scaffold175314_cov37-Prasinocladus_malaysianus.AAC.5
MALSEENRLLIADMGAIPSIMNLILTGSESSRCGRQPPAECPLPPLAGVLPLVRIAIRSHELCVST